MLVNTTKTSKTYGSHGPYKRSHEKQSALTKLKGVPLLLKYLAAFCVLDNVGAACTGPQKMYACFTLWDPVCGSDGITTYGLRGTDLHPADLSPGSGSCALPAAG